MRRFGDIIVVLDSNSMFVDIVQQKTPKDDRSIRIAFLFVQDLNEINENFENKEIFFNEPDRFDLMYLTKFGISISALKPS